MDLIKARYFKGRDDIKNLSSLGVKLIRLYDWDADNNHKPFLDYCQQNNIQVLVPVSNYNLGAFGSPPDMNASITGLINSFSNTGDNSGTDYHPAIHAIIISSELDHTTVPVSYLSVYTQKWVEIEQQSYSNN